MAKKIKKRNITTFAKKLLTPISPLITAQNKSTKKKIIDNYFKITKEEANEIMTNSFVPSNVNTQQNGYIDNISQYLQPVQMSFIKKKITYEKISKLAPELEQASLIVIPSILSPNSFRNYKMNFVVDLPDSILSTTTKNKISTFINEHVSTHIKMHEKIEFWIKEALYKTGAKPLLIIPPQLVNNLRNSSISFEDLYDQPNIIIDKDGIQPTMEELSVDLREDEKLSSMVNSINESILSEQKYTPRSKDYKRQSDKFYKLISTTLESIVNSEKKDSLVVFSDNISSIVSNKKNDAVTNQNIIDKYTEHFNAGKIPIFSQEPVLSLNDYYDQDSEHVTFPYIEELPTEAVIPLYIEGTPHRHIGYFVMIDEYGTPVSVSESDYNNFENSPMSNSHIDKLYNAHFQGCDGIGITDQSEKTRVYKQIYEHYLDKLIQNNLKGIGFNNVSTTFNSEINKIMLYRLFKHKKTRLVFVPEMLLTYFAFAYNSNGTGRSKIDDIIFPISLKITYLVVKTINLMEQAIHRQNVKIDLDDTVGNPLEILQEIKDKLVEGKISDITYDPVKIVKSLAEREIRITPNNIPGINQFSIEPEEHSSSRPIPDDSLIEEINNLINLNLDVPPSAFNRLNETEYSRSIITNNILFSKKIELRQNTVIKHISNLMKSYILLSQPMTNKIKDMLKDDKNKGVNDKHLNKELFNIIQHITLSLPTLRISHDKADFEEINNYTSMIEDLIDKLFPTDMITDRDNQDIFTAITTVLKSNILKDYLIDTQMIKQIDENVINLTDKFNITSLSDINQFVANTKKALDDIKSKIVPKEESNY